MDVQAFRAAFWRQFGKERNEPNFAYWDPLVMREVDLCPDVEGKLSIKKQQLLNLAFRFLAKGESYLEVGTYQGKSLLSALIDNPIRPVYACDNFSEFDVNCLELTQTNLKRYGMLERVTFYNCDFVALFKREKLPEPVGLYFYDGAHDFQSQYQAIKLVEPFLADEALVLIDDWRFAADSGSYARAATQQAIQESAEAWRVMYELPARFNGDQAMWWNGVGVLAFQRQGME